MVTVTYTAAEHMAYMLSEHQVGVKAAVGRRACWIDGLGGFRGRAHRNRRPGDRQRRPPPAGVLLSFAASIRSLRPSRKSKPILVYPSQGRAGRKFLAMGMSLEDVGLGRGRRRAKTPPPHRVYGRGCDMENGTNPAYPTWA